MSHDVLVSTQWVQENLNNPHVRLIESNEDQLLYPSGHITGAVEVDWVSDLNHPIIRDYLSKSAFESLASKIGITKDSILVFYGDRNNWWAAYAFWVFNLFGHRQLRIMDGGRHKWEKEKRVLTKEKVVYPHTHYEASSRDDISSRSFREQVLEHIRLAKRLVDVRSPAEFSGEKLHMEGYPNEGALRGGHIPGALNIPWSKAVNPDSGEFLPISELRALYLEQNRLDPKEDLICYCRIGERSAHSWFVLKYLLGFENVKNYDGSWTEWGNLVNVPIER